ncbi:MAG TPA: type II toxin-antitoxin system CcdA family antitoxin [Burkholderiaceae bacterium]|nr:type II toxin-antitoxin system CcdA family antitoxin [Burkholderiaceae bacterium]
MSTIRECNSRKRPVNLSLPEDLVVRAKATTDNLSEVVETLLIGYLAGKDELRQTQARQADALVEMWNAFHEREGSFADEHSTL